MKKNLISKLIPHILAIVIFLIVTAIFCKPALEGKVLSQHDTIAWKGMAQSAFEYKEKFGHYPLWNSNLFSGMPNYQVMMEGKNILPDITSLLSLGLPKPLNFFFLACICFYIFSLSVKARPVIGIFTSLAFAFSTYHPIIIGAGHDTKMISISLLPLLLSGLLLTYQKKYWIGLALITLGTYLQIGGQHPQISYYFFIIAAAISIVYLIQWIKAKEFKHAIVSFLIVAIGALTGLAGNSLLLATTAEYAQYTMRGGKSVDLSGEKTTVTKTSGLDTDYAFSYSFKPTEALVTLMPGVYGKSSSNTVGEESKVIDKLTALGIPQTSAVQLGSGLPSYWGGMATSSESTSGPPYLGALVCLLAILGFVLIKNPVRWAFLAASIVAIILAAGKYLPGINTFILENVPLYNKFRAPSMAIVILSLIIPVMALFCLQQLFFANNAAEYLQKNFKKVLYTMGGVIGILGLLYLTNDYSSPLDELLLNNRWDQSGDTRIGSAIVAGLKEDRSSMFGAQIMRTIGWSILLIATIWLFSKKIFNGIIATTILGIAFTTDLLIIGNQYLNEDNYVYEDQLTNTYFSPSPANNQILADTDPNFRVFNAAPDRFSEARTSYFHKSIGGYHAAKLRIYQDVIEKYLSAQPNMEILNMLNAKYFIIQDPQTRQQNLMPNPDAFGNAWFVHNIKQVANDAEEIDAIGSVNLKETAVIQNDLMSKVGQFQWDSTATITLTHYNSDTLIYESNSNTPQFAVFSEVYYPKGWNAYINDQKVDYIKTNYILRGLAVPAGKQTIKFVFEPETYKRYNNITFIASILILVFILTALFFIWKENKNK